METHPRLVMLAAALIVSLIAGVVTVGHTSANDRIVIVAPGDTLSQIAEEQGVSVADLMRLNGIRDPDQILVGQRLRVRGGHPSPRPDQPAYRSHVVAWGETLPSTARRYGTTVAELSRLNGIADPSYIQAGAPLRVPAHGPR